MAKKYSENKDQNEAHKFSADSNGDTAINTVSKILSQDSSSSNEISSTVADGKRGLDVWTLNESEQTSYGVKETVINNAFTTASPVYNLLPANFRSFNELTGTANVTNRQFVCNSGTTIGSYGAIQSFRSINIEYGQTALCRVAASFSEGKSSTEVGAGLISIGDEMSFGLNGTSFGVWHRFGGDAEVRTLTITAGASGSITGNLTINGTLYAIPLTSGTTSFNAFQIENYINTSVPGYDAEQVGATVIISANGDGPKSGTWSYSSTGASAGSIARTTTGITKTSNHIPIENFNGYVYSGFDYTKGQVYSINYGAGYTNIEYKIYDKLQNRFITAHTIDNINETTVPTVSNPNMKIGIYSYNIGSTDAVSVNAAFISGFSQGNILPTRNPRATSNTKSISSTLTNILTLKNSRTYNGFINQVEIEPLSVSIANESNKTIVLEIRTNPTVSGTTNFSRVETNLITQIDTSGTSVTSGTLLKTITVAPSNNQTFNLKDLDIRIPPTLRLCLAARQISGGASGDVTATIVWREDI